MAVHGGVTGAHRRVARSDLGLGSDVGAVTRRTEVFCQEVEVGNWPEGIE